MRINDILYRLDILAPFDTALNYDNPGLAVGSGSTEVTGILFTLDVTAEAIQKAAASGINLIISHHPVIFNPIKRIGERDIPYLLIKNGISSVSAHTNLDIADGGVNDVLASAIGLRNIVPLDSSQPDVIGRLGETDKTDVASFALAVKKALGAEGVEYSGTAPVSSVAVVSGAGGNSELEAAAAAGADTLVTGEARYHQFSDAMTLGINLIAAGHYDTENVVLEPLRSFLTEAFPELRTDIFNCRFTHKI